MKYLKNFNENQSDILYEEISDIDYSNRINRHGDDIEFSPDFRSKLVDQAGVMDITTVGPYIRDLYLTNHNALFIVYLCLYLCWNEV